MNALLDAAALAERLSQTGDYSQATEDALLLLVNLARKSATAAAVAAVDEAVVVIELYPSDDGDELGLLTEARAELKRMMRDGRIEKELQFCSGAVRIRRVGFDPPGAAHSEVKS